MPSRSFPSRSRCGTFFATAIVVSLCAATAHAEEPAAKSTTPAAPTATATSAATLAPDAPPDAESARPKPLEDPTPRPLPWDRMIDVGGDFLIAARTATNDAKGDPTPIRYQPATGFGLHLRFALLDHLLIEGYYVDVHHTITIPSGALGVTDPIAPPQVETYAFGARLSPSMTWGRVTAWLSAGVGWGRFEFQRAAATNSKNEAYVIRERGASFVELPVGAGARIELVKRWLSLDLTTTYAFIAGQHGEAFEPSQTIAPDGLPRALNAFPVIESSIVQSIGLSLLL